MFKLVSGRVYSRRELADLMGLTDRGMRYAIRLMRRQGIHILPLKNGGYKLAECESEKRQLLAMYKSRALDELKTYRALLATMQMDGQMEMEVQQ